MFLNVVKYEAKMLLYYCALIRYDIIKTLYIIPPPKVPSRMRFCVSH